MSDVGDHDAREEPEEAQNPPLVASGGEDISAGIIVSGAGGRRLDDDQEPGHGDLDEIVERGRTQGWGRVTGTQPDEPS